MIPKKSCLAFLAAPLFAACAMFPTLNPNVTVPTQQLKRGLAAPPTLAAPAPQPGDGSIPIDSVAVDPIADSKAFRVGDIVTVQVNEALTGSAGANSTLGNATSVKAGLSNLFGLEHYLSTHTAIDPSSMIDTSYQSSETGAGVMSASQSFVGNVGAVVTSITPTGNLVLAGKREMRINGEQDTLVITGVVRPDYIDANDEVPSSSIADFTLGLTGNGQVRDQQGFGWGERLLSWIWPF
ncbi:MAG: flagellar basal body L-ring protein FlgH [Candidatus Binataceae bacterium]